mgnify:CR=1 FL=1
MAPKSGDISVSAVNYLGLLVIYWLKYAGGIYASVISAGLISVSYV